MGIANFDVLPAGDIFEVLFNFHPTLPANSFYEENGYESSNIAECLGTFYLIFLYMLVKLVILLVIHPFTVFKYPQKFSKWLRHDLFWNEIFRFLLEGYLETSISAMINYDWMYWENWSDCLINSSIIFFSGLAYSAPILTYVFMSCNMFRVTDPDFEGVYGALYEGLNTENRHGGMYYPVFFTTRRLILACLFAFAKS